MIGAEMIKQIARLIDTLGRDATFRGRAAVYDPATGKSVFTPTNTPVRAQFYSPRDQLANRASFKVGDLMCYIKGADIAEPNPGTDQLLFGGKELAIISASEIGTHEGLIVYRLQVRR